VQAFIEMQKSCGSAAFFVIVKIVQMRVETTLYAGLNETKVVFPGPGCPIMCGDPKINFKI
jgi:hypothetical protein